MWFLEKYKHFRLYVQNTHTRARQKAEESLWDRVEEAHEGPTDRVIVTWQMIDFFGLRYVHFFKKKRRNYLYFFVSNIYFFGSAGSPPKHWDPPSLLWRAGPFVVAVDLFGCSTRTPSCGAWDLVS